jgi:hypothetical protein
MKAKPAVTLASFAAVSLTATRAFAHGQEAFTVAAYSLFAMFHVLLGGVLFFLAPRPTIFVPPRASLARRFLFAGFYWLSMLGIWVLMLTGILPLHGGLVSVPPIVLIITFGYFLTHPRNDGNPVADPRIT